MTFMVIRLLASLAAVVGLMLLLARWSNRRFAGNTAMNLRVVARQGLTRGSSIAVVEAGSKVLVVGLTDHQVQLLTELDAQDAAALASQEPAGVAPEGAGRHARTSVRAVADVGSPVGGPATPEPSAPDADQAGGALAGSVLSLDTWRQAIAAAKRGRAS